MRWLIRSWDGFDEFFVFHILSLIILLTISSHIVGDDKIPDYTNTDKTENGEMVDDETDDDDQQPSYSVCHNLPSTISQSTIISTYHLISSDRSCLLSSLSYSQPCRGDEMVDCETDNEMMRW